jgi:AcrR family transcriptional regulator
MNETRRERERLMREAEIVAAAEKIFGQKGFDGALMDEIALEAQFTKRTVYLYFGAKEELFFAAATSSFKKLYTYLQKAAENGRTGLDKLLQGSKEFFRFYRDFPNAMRVIGEIGYVKKKAGEESQRLKELMDNDNGLFGWVAKVMAEGKGDGSIREDVDTMKTTFSIIFLMTGFFNQLALTGTTFMEHFKLDPENFTDYSMELLFYSIRNSPEERDG